MMTVLLPHGRSPKGFGLGHDNSKLYVLSKCCGQKVTFDTSTGEVNYKCVVCEVVFPGSDINSGANWLPEVYLVNFRADNAADDKDKINGWLYSWTGQSDIVITAEGV